MKVLHHDKDAFKHPAPFLIKDVEKLISMFTKKGMTILDPFCGSGTSLISSAKLKRFGIGIDINPSYQELAIQRLEKFGFQIGKDYRYLIEDANVIVPTLKEIDYIITSPPYHNILKNKSLGIRKVSTNGHRNGSRVGIEYYSDMVNDLGNKESYDDFLYSLKKIMGKCFNVLNEKKYCSIIISDFTVDKREMCVQGDIVSIMDNIGFKFVGTTVLLQESKPLYPFGYPYAFIINHHHQYILNFKKE